jgi:hypothetical protein
MRLQAASLGFVMMLTSIAPALAQEAPPAESTGSSAPVAPLREPTPETGRWDEWSPLDDLPLGRTKWRSPGMAAGGTVLTVLGTASAVLGVVGLAGSGGGGGGAPNYSGVFGGAFLGGGALMLGIGIPMIVSGATEISVGDVPPAAQTQLRVGAGSIDFSTEF